MGRLDPGSQMPTVWDEIIARRASVQASVCPWLSAAFCSSRPHRPDWFAPAAIDVSDTSISRRRDMHVSSLQSTLIFAAVALLCATKAWRYVFVTSLSRCLIKSLVLQFKIIIIITYVWPSILWSSIRLCGKVTEKSAISVFVLILTFAIEWCNFVAMSLPRLNFYDHIRHSQSAKDAYRHFKSLTTQDAANTYFRWVEKARGRTEKLFLPYDDWTRDLLVRGILITMKHPLPPFRKSYSSTYSIQTLTISYRTFTFNA